MSLFKEVIYLLSWEFRLEWRQKFAIGGLLLYALSMVVVIGLAFGNDISPLEWNILLWLIILFAGINVVAKSFHTEASGRRIYLYTLARPSSIILAKSLYNFVLLFGISGLSCALFSLITEISLSNPAWIVLMLALGSAVLAANLSLISAISAQADNRNILLAVLSFPLVIPVLLTLIKNTRYGLDPNLTDPNMDGVILLLGITGILVGISVILFPFVWRN
ncbi:MAG: heme exporter protein CcmB [Bacteroidota bacterium]